MVAGVVAARNGDMVPSQKSGLWTGGAGWAWVSSPSERVHPPSNSRQSIRERRSFDILPPSGLWP
jgi:hypothetical protein